MCPAADPATHSVAVRIAWPGMTDAPQPGVTARVEFPIAQTGALLRVPRSATVQRGELSGVYLAVLVLIPLVAFEIVVGLPSAGWAPTPRRSSTLPKPCLLYTSDAADDLLCVDLGGRRIIKKKTTIY